MQPEIRRFAIVMTALGTLREVWQLRRAWWFTATARTKARFARTVLGSFWLGLSNLLSIAVLALVYGTVFKVQNFSVYVVYLGLGLVVWNAISAAISSAPNLFEHNAAHIHNTNTNPIFYALEEWAFQLQTFMQSFALVLLALLFFQGDLVLNLLLYGWLPLLNLALFCFWVPLLICLWGAQYRDLYQLVPIVLQLAFLLSPILYFKKNLGSFAWTAEMNPLFQVLNPIRESLMHGHLDLGSALLVLFINLLGIVYACFRLETKRSQLPFMI